MIRFVKAHACGNDFLIIDEQIEDGNLSEVARRLCARTTGVGADGVEYLTPGANDNFSIRLFNSNGSEGELSGNGTRCVAAWLAQKHDFAEVSLRTLAGLRKCRIEKRDPPRYLIATEMGVPALEPKTVRLKDGTATCGFSVSLGNPHFVIFVENVDFEYCGLPWRERGAELCTHTDFPHGTNVEFVLVIDTSTIAFRIFERGAGPTLSSGTGSSASAAASMATRGLARRLTVIAEGGEQTVEWIDTNSSLVLTGPAEIIAEGECLLL